MELTGSVPIGSRPPPHPACTGRIRPARQCARDRIRPLPPGLSLRRAVLAEPPSVTLNAALRAGEVRGKRVLVTGAGTAGCLVMAALRHCSDRMDTSRCQRVKLRPRVRRGTVFSSNSSWCTAERQRERIHPRGCSDVPAEPLSAAWVPRAWVRCGATSVCWCGRTRATTLRTLPHPP